jgi:outer membrane receptor protein involved in Fe transport
LTLAAATSQTALAAPCRQFHVAAGPLTDALIAFGSQAGISIGGTDSPAASVRTRGVSGCYAPAAALNRLLKGTGYDFRAVDTQTIRLFHVPVAPRRSLPARVVAAVIRRNADPDSDIVVTASKQRTLLADYPASAQLIDVQDAFGHRSAGSDALVSRLPVLTQTNLGPGRNKLFIRGIADSSFTGPSQSTVGQYLGDVRLTYSAPDPNLNLYDIDRVEVLEGPQGTLYGAGSLGGIVSLIPKAPDKDKLSGAIAVGAESTAHGGSGSDIAAMANIPIASDMAVRAVAYRTLAPGYIDDTQRGLKDVNRTNTYGGRVSIRITPGDDWTIDTGVVLHNSDSDDGQYTEKGQPPLTRRSTIAQPFDNDYLLGQLVVRKTWDGMEMVSATGVARQRLNSSSDATGFVAPPGPAVLVEDTAISLISHESRLSADLSGGGHWTAGLAFVENRQRMQRLTGTVDAPEQTSNVRNTDVDIAAFGEARVALGHAIFATAGARISYSYRDGEVIDREIDDADEPRRHALRVLPSVALSWKPIDKLLMFVRYQQGFRAGGLSVDGAAADPTVREFISDSIGTVEVGARWGNAGSDPLSASITASHATWSNIQADLVGTTGLPFTANVGDGQVNAIEAILSWSPAPGVRLDGALFANNSRLAHPAPGFVDADEDELPNIPELGARLGARLTFPMPGEMRLIIDGNARYSGASRLGVGPLLNIPQGGYVDAAIEGRLELGAIGLTLGVTNLADERGNRFAFGNPFTVTQRTQMTPLRPRTVRIGIDASF